MLKTKVTQLPELTERRTKLQSTIAQYEKEAAQLSGEEVNLQEMQRNLMERLNWGRLDSLQDMINKKTKELDLVIDQINQKRTFLDKMLGRKAS